MIRETGGILLVVAAALRRSVLGAGAQNRLRRHDTLPAVLPRASGSPWSFLIRAPGLVGHLARPRLLRLALLFGTTLFVFAGLAHLPFAEARAIGVAGPVCLVLALGRVEDPRRAPGRHLGLLVDAGRGLPSFAERPAGATRAGAPVFAGAGFSVRDRETQAARDGREATP